MGGLCGLHIVEFNLPRSGVRRIRVWLCPMSIYNLYLFPRLAQYEAAKMTRGKWQVYAYVVVVVL